MYFIDRLSDNFKSVALTNGPKLNFYERMNNDVKDRNSRDKEFKEMFSKRFSYEQSNKVTKKHSESITKRLFTARKSNISKRLSTSKSMRSLNLSKSSQRATSSKRVVTATKPKPFVKKKTAKKQNKILKPVSSNL